MSLTKECLQKNVEVAAQIYELLKQYPVTERGFVLVLVDKFNQQDWDVHHKAEKAQYVSQLASPGPSY